MRSAGTIELPEEFSESKRAALLNLLGDDDLTVYQTVREKILSCGPAAAEWLRPHTLSGDPALRRRARHIVRHFDRQAADNRFLGFCLKHGEEFGFEQGLWLLAQTEYPEINIEAYKALLDSFAGEVSEHLQPGRDPKEILSKLNDYLFRELRFTGNEKDYYDPQNSYLNRVI